MAARQDNTAAQLVAGHVKAPGATSGNSARNTNLTHDAIAAEAYTLWTERGCRDGNEIEDWLDAERRLRDREGTHGGPPDPADVPRTR
jgi:hypothetical protein